MTDSLHKYIHSGVFINKERPYYNVFCSYVCHLSPLTCYCVVNARHAGELCTVESVELNLALGQVLIQVFPLFYHVISIHLFLIHSSIFPEMHKGSLYLVFTNRLCLPHSNNT